MLKKKEQVLQIRLDTELLGRFKAMAEHHGVSVSVMLRHSMESLCSNFEAAQLRKAEYAKSQQERKR